MRNIITFLLAISFSQLYANIKGVNYDPAHSSRYVEAQAGDNLDLMKSEIEKDLDILKKNNLTHIKTFYSSFGTIHDPNKYVIFADLACAKDLKILLGVYVFKNNCDTWCDKATQEQVDRAIASASNPSYTGCITGIVVGNENAYSDHEYKNFDKNLVTKMNNHIKKIKADLEKNNVRGIPVGSAQQDGAWEKLAQSDDPVAKEFFSNLDFIGFNYYPYWERDSQGKFKNYTVDEAIIRFDQRFNELLPLFESKTIIITEEGWPSNHNPGQNPNASKASEQQYYNWWHSPRGGLDNYDSYYFSMFDKLGNQGADTYFGLCTDNRGHKIDGINCE